MPAPIIAVELAAKAGAFLVKHRDKLYPVALLILLFLWFRAVGSGMDYKAKWEACENRPAPSLSAAVSSTQTARVLTKIQIIYKDKASPCPDVAIDSDSSAFQGVTATASVNGPVSEPPRPQNGPFSVTLGGAFYNGGAYLALGGGYWWETRLGAVGLEGLALFPPAWEESQSTRRPVGILALTARP